MTASSTAHHTMFIFLLRQRSTQILIYLHVSLHLCYPADPTVQEPLENRSCFCSMYPWWPAQSLICGQFSSVNQSYPTLADPMDCSTPGLPVHHQLPELTQTQVHSVRDAIQQSHPLASPSPPALNLSQHQGLFK